MALFPVTPGLSNVGDNFILALAHFSVHDASFNKRILALQALLSNCVNAIADRKSQFAKGLPFKAMVVCPEYFFAGFKTGAREGRCACVTAQAQRGLSGYSSCSRNAFLCQESRPARKRQA